MKNQWKQLLQNDGPSVLRSKKNVNGGLPQNVSTRQVIISMHMPKNAKPIHALVVYIQNVP